MKTTKPKLLSVIITMSVTINAVMLGGLGYIASIDHRIDKVYSIMNEPVVVYVSNGKETLDAPTSIQTPATK